MRGLFDEADQGWGISRHADDLHLVAKDSELGQMVSSGSTRDKASMTMTLDGVSCLCRCKSSAASLVAS